MTNYTRPDWVKNAPVQYQDILELHDKWLKDIDGGKRANLGGANLGGANLEGANLEGANLEGADLRGANLLGANLRGANLRGANLWGANLRGAYLGGANLGGANLRDANLGGANLWGAYLVGANLRDADLGEKYGKIKSERPIFQIFGIGSENSSLVSFFCEKAVVVNRGCFWGTLEEFEKKVKEVHGDNNHSREYQAAIQMIKTHNKIWNNGEGNDN